MRAFRLIALTALAAVLGCTFDPVISSPVSISCAMDGSCPVGLACQRTVNVCVATPDETLPALRSATLVIAPSQANPLPAPTRLGVEGTAIITFVTTVPVRGVPVLRTTPPLSCPFTGLSDSQFEVSCRVQDLATPDGRVTITADVVGANLNASTIDLTDAVNLVVDLTPPPVPDTLTPNRIVYRRVPWGMDSTGGAASFSVTGFAGAVSDAALVRVVSDGTERGRATVVASGGFSAITLNPVDAPSVDVVAVDQAGNQSAAVLVHDVEWFATLGGRVAGSSTENPHAFEWVRAKAPILKRDDGVEAGAEEGLARVDSRNLHVEAGASWQQRTFRWPEQRETAFAYDSARGRLVRFGGMNNAEFAGASASNELMEWNGTDWFSRLGVGGDGVPPPRTETAMAYDEKTQKVTVFGGRDKTVLADTWQWNGTAWRRGPAGPAARYQAVLFADPRRGRLLLLGGRDADGGVLDDFWEFSRQQWRQLDAGTPPARAGAATAFDRSTGDTWLFGGATDTGLLADTWRFDGTRWESVPTGPPPPARRSASMVFDSEAQRLLLLGGASADGGTLRDLWMFDGGTWSSGPASPGEIDPTPSFFTDTVRGRMVLAAEGTDGLWRWSGSAWQRLITRVDPPAAAGRVPMTRVKDGVVMLASLPSAMRVTQSLLQWTADGWLALPANVPPARSAAQDLTYDPLNDRLMLLSPAGTTPPVVTSIYRYGALIPGWTNIADGGLPAMEDGGVRTFSSLISGAVGLPDRGAALAWTSDGPLALWSPGMVLQVVNGCLSAISDVGASQLYRLNAQNAWVEEGPALSENLLMTTSASLPDGGAVFAGSRLPAPGSTEAPRAMAYQWTGGTLVPLPDTPTGGVLSMTWDEASGRLLAFGGFNPGLTTPAVLYQLGASGWQPILTNDPEGDGDIEPRTGAAFAHYADAGTNIAFGGFSMEVTACSPSIKSFSDTWQLHLSAQRPAGVFRVSAAAAQIPDGFVPTQLTLQVSAGGHGENAQSAIDGYQVEVWRAGRWNLEQGVFSAPGQLQPATVRIQNPQHLEQLLRGQRDLMFQLSPLGANGTSVASLDVDYVQLKLEYRLP